MNGNGIFVLAEKVAGNFYVSKGIQGMAGQTVTPEGFQVRKIDPGRSVQAIIRGKDGCRQPLHLCYFSEHPSEKTLREVAVVV